MYFKAHIGLVEKFLYLVILLKSIIQEIKEKVREINNLYNK